MRRVRVQSEIKVNYTSAPASEKCHYDKPIDRVDVSPTLISSVGVAEGVANRCITSRPVLETRFVRIVAIPRPFRRSHELSGIRNVARTIENGFIFRRAIRRDCGTCRF